MAEGLGNITTPGAGNVFIIGWFRFPIGSDENYHVVNVLHDILVVASFLLNPVLLSMIIWNPGSKKRTTSNILLASICLVNILLSGFGLVMIIDSSIISYDIMSRAMSIFLPKYFATSFLLALNNYVMIVEPLKYKIFAPKPRNAILMVLLIWLVITVILIIGPYLADDYDTYVKIMMTVVVGLCWLITIPIMAMYVKILKTLQNRKLALQRTFNMSASRQGIQVIRKNSRLAKVLLVYIAVLVLFTLPLFTGFILVMHCPDCNQPAIIKFCLYMIPISMTVPVLHPVHWLFGTPQYCKETRELARKVLTFFTLAANE